MHVDTTIRVLILLGALSLSGALAGCTTAPNSTASATTAAAAPTLLSAGAAADIPEAAPKLKRVDVPIPDASLLPLLEAEFALRGGAFGRALSLLSEQCQTLDDPELCRRGLRLAEFLRDDRRALDCALRLTDLDPQDGETASNTMTLLLRQGEISRALALGERAKALGARINAPLLVAEFAERDAAERTAISEALQRWVDRYPDDVDIAIADALLKREMLDYSAAANRLNAVLVDTPNEERALVLWTQVQLDLEGDAPFERIATVVEDEPGNERLRLQYARLLAANERFVEASAQFTALIETSPRNDEYLMAGSLIELELGRWQAAIDTLQSLVDMGLRVDEAHYYLGRAYEGAGDNTSAVEAYAEVGGVEQFADAKRRATLLLGTDSATVGEFFNAQRQRHADQSERLYLIEAELRRRQSPWDAINVYSAALEDFPDSLPLRYSRAMLYEAEGDIAAMEADLREILAQDPDNATTLNALGYTLTNNTSRYAEAAALIERALAISPREPAMLDSLGWVYFKMGRVDEAETILREAYALLPDPEVAAHLGETLWYQGKHLEAEDIWRAGLDRDAENTHILATLKRLGVVLD